VEQDIIFKIIELLGTFAFAISGIRHAAAKQYDWFGGYVCGIAVAIGGGTIRDVMLSTTPFWMTTPIYMVCTAVALTVEERVVVFRHPGTGALHHCGSTEIVGFRAAVLGGYHHGMHHGFCRWCHPRRAIEQRARHFPPRNLCHRLCCRRPCLLVVRYAESTVGTDRNVVFSDNMCHPFPRYSLPHFIAYAEGRKDQGIIFFENYLAIKFF